jgi:hypothetical protein
MLSALIGKRKFLSLAVRTSFVLLTLLVTGSPTHALSLFVSDRSSDSILRYDGTTGALIGVFASGGDLHVPTGIVFGADGNLYVADNVGVLRYDGSTGAPLPSSGNSGAFFFVAPNIGGLAGAEGLTFGSDKNLYVTSVTFNAGGFPDGRVLRFNGSTGTFIDAFVTFNTDLDFPSSLVFGPDGNLYIGIRILAAAAMFCGTVERLARLWVSLPRAARYGGLSGESFSDQTEICM